MFDIVNRSHNHVVGLCNIKRDNDNGQQTKNEQSIHIVADDRTNERQVDRSEGYNSGVVAGQKQELNARY